MGQGGNWLEYTYRKKGWAGNYYIYLVPGMYGFRTNESNQTMDGKERQSQSKR